MTDYVACLAVSYIVFRARSSKSSALRGTEDAVKSALSTNAYLWNSWTMLGKSGITVFQLFILGVWWNSSSVLSFSPAFTVQFRHWTRYSPGS
jgi:hypothetical protein